MEAWNLYTYVLCIYIYVYLSKSILYCYCCHVYVMYVMYSAAADRRNTSDEYPTVTVTPGSYHGK